MSLDDPVRTPADLIAAGLAPAERLAELERIAARYAITLTPAVADLIDPTDQKDPIARQYLPMLSELDVHTDEYADPIGDDAHSPVEGIVHRYPDRVLLKPIHVCAVYCRFCFRREMVGPGKRRSLSPQALAGALEYIRTNQAIWEVIITGGDPLILSSRRLRLMVRQLAGIEHVKIVRVHTRLPVVDPARITPEKVRALRAPGKATYVVLHANHPRELTETALTACARLIDAGIPMLSQSVLLRGVNDNAETLERLMRLFVENRIKPYYLHHADLAPGTAHLRTTIGEGQELVLRLRGHVSGLAQPTYMLDIPGGFGKSPIGPSYLSMDHDGGSSAHYVVTDYQGHTHFYRDRPSAPDASAQRAPKRK
jgi:lysine 2,3-aminomutase